jgi:LPS-assembly lipoprotein
MLIKPARIKPMRGVRRASAVRAAARCLLALGAVVALAACGFHLEGSLPTDQSMTVTRVESAQPHSEFFRALQDALRIRGTRVVSEHAAAPVTLKILEDNTGQRVLSVSARNIPREYEVFYSVRFTLEGTQGELIEPQSLVATRSYTYDEMRVLGKSAEEEQVRRALAADLARQVVRRLAAAPETPPAPAG